MIEIQENLIGALGMLLRIALFIYPLVFASMCMVPGQFRRELLARNYDGKRMTMFGLGALFMSAFAPNSLVMVAFAAFASTLVAFGSLIWLPDFITNRAINRWMLPLYVLLAGAAYFVGAGYGNFGVSGANFIGLKVLILPVGMSILAGSMAVFAMLTEEFKVRILPQDNSGNSLVVVGILAFVVAIFNSNPIAMVSLSASAATLVAFGLLIAVPESVTSSLLKTWLTPMYLLFTLWIFFQVDVFTSAVISSVLLFTMALVMGVWGGTDFLKSTTTPKPRVKSFVPGLVYGVISILLFVFAGFDLLIR